MRNLYELYSYDRLSKHKGEMALNRWFLRLWIPLTVGVFAAIPALVLTCGAALVQLSGGSLDDLFDRIGSRPVNPMSAVFSAAMREWRRSTSRAGRDSDDRQSLSERIDRVMQITLNRELEQLERYMTFLASVGSTAPFVGLFGTVWGIMNSFSAIAVSKNTSLAVVAPGIAEALFATALGLVAAIPAVIAYNKLTTDINRYAGRLEAFAGEFGAILSRQSEDGE